MPLIDFQAIIQKYVEGFLDEKLTVENAKKVVDDGIQAVADFVGNTSTTIDDAVFAEVEAAVDFEHIAVVLTEKARAALGLPSKVQFASGKPKIFLSLLRLRLTNELVRKERLTRAEARAKVAKASDELLLSKVKECGVSIDAVGDGSIIQWLKDHAVVILQILSALLPLLMLL